MICSGFAFFVENNDNMSAKESTQFRDELVAETRRRIIDENIPRIKACLAELTSAEIWLKPNKNSNSVGNLVLHLCGNVTQWVGCGLGKLPDDRTRDWEFDEKGPLPTTDLIQKLDTLIVLLETVLSKITPEDLLQKHKVQIYVESGVSILTHVIEHFSFHTGQITYFVKWRKNIDTKYYGGDDL